MSSQVIVSSGRDLLGLGVAGTEAGGVGHSHHAPHVGRGQPALLVVVGPGEFPAFILERERNIIIICLLDTGIERRLKTFCVTIQNISLFFPRLTLPLRHLQISIILLERYTTELHNYRVPL